VKTIEHWIDGATTRGAATRTSPVWNPATGEQQAEVVLGSTADVDDAVRVATEAFESWSQASISRRAKILFAFRELVNAHVDELAELITDEHGKVLSDARGEVQRGLEVVEFACGIRTCSRASTPTRSHRRRHVHFREPLGCGRGSRRSTSR
jgi:malonate-semialdehyde dehydrogenase (acetylating)/methylmalonate-semialdehyde dehydrogenase